MTRATVIVACALLFASTLSAQTTLDGNSWADFTLLTKTAYVRGFLDGVNPGATVLAMTSKKAKASTDAIAETVVGLVVMVSGLEPGQIVDGVDAFYKDFRNRRIAVSAAVPIVINQINGMPQAEIDAWLERQRSEAR